MTTRTYDAVYENGVFRPVALPDDLEEGQHVQLIVRPSHERVLDLATQVYAGLTEGQVEEIEKIALDRKLFFDRTER